MNSSAAYMSNACLSGGLSDINAARQKEGLGRLQLPSNFRSLSLPQQLFVLTNIERVDRGLWPVLGESSRLNSVGARSGMIGNDVLSCSSCYGSANWGSTRNQLWSHFLWMYDDGPGSPNTAGDWGHRHNILVTNYPSPFLMGAGVGTRGTGEIFQGADTADRADVLTWSAETPYFHPIHVPTLRTGVSGGTISVQLTGHSHTIVKLQIWRGGAWSTVANYTTPGTPAIAAMWTKSIARSAGSYRVVAMENTRYTRVYGSTLTVR
jgi:hypothetical protein